MPGLKGAQCRVCNSPNKDYYETLYYQSKGKIGWVRLSEKAADRGENISRKSFQRHFNKHYIPERIQNIIAKGLIDSRVSKTRTEAIDILEEIKGNLVGLKALIARAKGSKNIGAIAAVYKEARLTLQDIERLENKLSAKTVMTEAELYREFFWAQSILCKKCVKKFRVKLDERLRAKGYS